MCSIDQVMNRRRTVVISKHKHNLHCSNFGFGHCHILTSQNVYYRTHITVIIQGVIKLPIHLIALFDRRPKIVTLSPDICFCDKNRNYR
jgi:uncharacterized phosphosugar-binding protein